jgi:hypothetical protein
MAIASQKNKSSTGRAIRCHARLNPKAHPKAWPETELEFEKSVCTNVRTTPHHNTSLGSSEVYCFSPLFVLKE